MTDNEKFEVLKFYDIEGQVFSRLYAMANRGWMSGSVWDQIASRTRFEYWVNDTPVVVVIHQAFEGI